MKINGKEIAESMKRQLKKEINQLKKGGKTIKLTTFLISTAPDQLSFVKIKRETAKKLHIGFELIHLKSAPSFECFMRQIKEKSTDPNTTGIVIQQPLPAKLSTESIYQFIPLTKEIESRTPKSPFLPPLGLAVLTVLKYIYLGGKSVKNLFIDAKKDRFFFKKLLSEKRIILVGKGLTAGTPIGKTLTHFKINYLGIHSQTPKPESYYKEADIIITAVGKKHIQPEFLKKGVILINAGLRKENGKLRGDFDEEEIKNIASFYTPTPGGIGPIDVIYLFKNLVEAAKLQR